MDQMENTKRQQQWIAHVEKVVADIRANYLKAEAGGIHLAWGYANREHKEIAKKLPGEVSALLSWGKADYDLLIRPWKNNQFLPSCRLLIRLPAPQILPRNDGRKLFSAMIFCDVYGVSLALADIDVEDPDPDIVVFGVSVTVPFESLTARTLLDALLRLSEAGDDLLSILQSP